MKLMSGAPGPVPVSGFLLTRFGALTTLVAGLCLSPPAGAPADEFRGLWVDAWGSGFLDASQVTTLVADCRAFNFNAIVVQMRRRGDAFYNATLNDPKTTAIASGFDALQEIITEAHSGTPRLEVHCWVTTHVIWSSSTPPTQPGHVFNLHPEYLTRNSSGTNYISEGYYLDPGHPDATLWNYQMATNIVRRYDVDGFHWDYIRYPQQDSGFNPVAVARYNDEFGLSGQPGPSNAQFSDWRRRQVTDFLRWVNADLLALKPNLVVSCAVFGSRTDAYNARFQDWAGWNSEGIIDICMPMGYTANNYGVFVPRVDDGYVHQGVRRIYNGQGAYLNTKENTVWQLDYIRNKPLLGSILYSYRTPNSGTVDQAATFAYIRDNHQPTWANVPAIPWKTTPTNAILRGTIVRQADGQAVYNALVTINSSPARNQKTEPHGKFAFFEAPPGTYLVTATANDLGTATTNVTLAAGTNRAVVLALPPDATPPVISSVGTSNLADTSITIRWTTDEKGTSIVDYGPTVGYGSLATDLTLTLGHQMSLTGLTPNSLYHYRVRSCNAAGLQATSGDFTFRTNPSGVVSDVIVESRDASGSLTPDPPYADAGFSDSTLKSSAVGLMGSGSRYAISGTPNFTLKPTLPVAGGTYDVYVTHGNAASVSDDIIVAVTQTGCAGLPPTTPVLQQAGANTWEYLGRLTLNSGVSVPTLRFAYSSGTLNGNGNGRMYSDSAKFVYVPPPQPPLITSQPVDRTVGMGGSVTFTAGASGTLPLSYRWHFEGAPISGATNTSYTLTSVEPTHAGVYTVVISNIAGAVTSSPAFLTVIQPPVILTHPQSQTAKAGATVAFTVSAEGTEPFSYAWRFNGTPLAGATESTLVLSPVHTNQAGIYRVVVTNLAASVTSSNAVLTVSLPQPPWFESIAVLPDGRARLELGGEPGLGFAVDAAAAVTGTWVEILSGLLTNVPLEILDPSASNAPIRYYRARH